MENIYLRLADFLYRKCTFINKLYLTDFRRSAIKAYSELVELPFEYALAKGIAIGIVIQVMAIMYGLSGGMSPLMIMLLMLVAIPGGIWLQKEEIRKSIVRNDRETTVEFARLASNCTLFICSGLSVRRAFIVSSACVESQRLRSVIDDAVAELETNTSTNEVLANLNARLKHAFVAEFTSILIQFEKYGAGAKSDLDRLIKSSWQRRRDAANQAAKEMETKLVFPSMLIFFGVMIMIAVAMIMQLGF